MAVMHRDRALFHVVFGLAAACWLAAGPGGVVMRAALACRHAEMHGHGGPAHQGAPTPNGGPCFCAGMVGVLDQVVSEAVPAVEPVGALVTVPVVTASASSAVSLPLSPAFTPETPPPIAG